MLDTPEQHAIGYCVKMWEERVGSVMVRGAFAVCLMGESLRGIMTVIKTNHKSQWYQCGKA